MIIKPKGTHDIYGEEMLRWQYVSRVIDEIMDRYNYGKIRTPLFESTELFHRGVGDTTDIVSKETYDFIDRGDRNMTLRPEGTAGVVRSYIENKMYGDPIQPIKLYYNGTMYRYERPQSGRDRELTQFGVEVLGCSDPAIDAEVISLAVNIFKLLGLKGVKVKINSLGDTESRNNYRKALIKYFTPRINELCPDCQERLKKNPLRILDCKFDANHELIKNAPVMLDYLNEESKNRFEDVENYLDVLDIDYEVDPKIVRGLDYYSHTVFEIEATVKDFGANNVLAGGGRYDTMVSNLGGPDTPGIGFACGIGRLVMALEKENVDLPIKKDLDVFILYANDTEKEYAIALTQDLRLNGFRVETEYMNHALKGQFKQADRLNAKMLIILNDEDLVGGEIQVKDNLTKEVTMVKEAEIDDYLDLNLR
ncbi:MAG TPA: histidine--tRNA ligase [Firmicutes bacterium]|nr:histidine--tRNA ligase [Bacillota bacterium]